MLKNYIQVAFRNILKQKVYNLLNTVGLATAIAAGLIIALHIREELSYEKDFKDYGNIYRVHYNEWAKSSPPLAIEMANALPHIEVIGRLALHGEKVINYENSKPKEVTGFFADSSLLKVFSLTLLHGDARQALAVTNSVLLTETISKHYFGDQDPVGKIVMFNNHQEMTVTGVIQDIPNNSHLKFDYLVSMPTFYENTPADWASNRGWMVMYTYMRVKDEKAFHQTLMSIPQFVRKFYEGEDNLDQVVASNPIKFMPLADIHLHSNLEQEMNANSSILYVYVFIIVEILILLIASANFMSLFTTQAIKRTKEVGMRKIMGAKPVNLMSQFFTEVILLTLFSLILAVIFYQLILPFYNSISGKGLSAWQIFENENLVVIAGIIIAIVAISGLYPAFFIAKFRGGSFLRDSKLPSSMPNLVRNGLVVFQFAVSVALIASTIVVRQQMKLIESKELGFDKDQVVNIKLYGELWWKAMNETDVFKNEFLKNSDIIAVGKSSNAIGDDLSVEGFVPEGKEEDADKYPSVRVLRIDEDYINVMGIMVLEGRNFSKDFNDSSSFIINQEAAKVLGLTNAVGKRINNVSMGVSGTVVGIIKDYHFTSLHNNIEPLILEYKPEWTGNLSIKIRGGKTQQTLAYMESTVKMLAPTSLFVYNFMDDHLNNLYKSEMNMNKVFQFFSFLAIVIACLGLLSLTAYTIESRTKEIGIRKVLGATVVGIVTLVSSKFFKLVLLAFILAVPLTWYAMHLWLQNFAFQIDIQWWVFALTGGIILLTALAVVSFQTITAAIANPVDSLRYE
jgi:putative ABC transport system permease protein